MTVATQTQAALPGTVPQRAMVIANRFILSNMRDRFVAGSPQPVAFPTRTVWMVPVLLTYPGIGSVGQVGLVAVDETQEAVIGWTPVDEMEQQAQRLYDEHEREIKAALL